MAGPQTAAQALAWAKAALSNNVYITAAHLHDRLQQRRVTIPDVRRAIATATKATIYDSQPQHNGTPWRLSGGETLDGDPLTVGIECFMDRGARRIVICTVM